jgi:DNA-binding NarL/FixJ family response regulator
MKVLHCEDEKELRDEMKKLLKTLPDVESIAVAQDGKKAVKLLQKEQFDLVISDIGMPEMDGIELLEEIKKSWPDVPVIMYSFSSIEKKGLQCLLMGAHGFVSKADPPSELRKAIHMVMEGEKYIPREIKYIKGKLDKMEKEKKQKAAKKSL